MATQTALIDPAHALAEAVHALRVVQSEKKAAMQEFGERLENLQNTIDRLTHEILTGQGSLQMTEN